MDVGQCPAFGWEHMRKRAALGVSDAPLGESSATVFMQKLGLDDSSRKRRSHLLGLGGRQIGGPR